MTSSGEGLRILRGWKKSKVFLYAEFVLVGVPSFSCDIVQVEGVAEDELELSVPPRTFVLERPKLEARENVPHRFKNSLNRVVEITLEDGGRIVLVESLKM